ncbi:SHOCT domain-containing protein [Agromyces sp. NPDC058064]|uniref:SHOCT domain-containing protein n=1 Tax=Agromyces sp. NPDC058064 TaxID=3346322 RepID=UPI0036DCDBD9
MYSSFGGWHFLMVIGVLLVFALIIAAIVVPIVLVTRRTAPPAVPQAPHDPTPAVGYGTAAPAAPRTVETRLRELDSLRDRGLITPAEHEAQRQAIIRDV